MLAHATATAVLDNLVQRTEARAEHGLGWTGSAAADGSMVADWLTSCCREDTAWAYDTKTSSFLVFGGWASRWLGDLIRLDVSAIIGPPYACTGGCRTWVSVEVCWHSSCMVVAT